MLGATVNYHGQHGTTPLHKAAEKAFPVLIKALCEARADPDSRDHMGALAKPIAGPGQILTRLISFAGSVLLGKHLSQ